jgi:hypothetical protein
MIQFLRPLLYFSAVIAIAALLASLLIPDQFITPALPFLIPFFTAVTLLSYHYLVQATFRKFIKFVNIFLLSIILKLLLYLAVMVTYAFLQRADAVPFLFAFFILYLCYTIFESVSIIRFAHKVGQQETSGSSR